jgi:WD40 repeat protein
MTDLDALLKSRGVSQDLGAHVTACAFNRAGTQAGFALGDGKVHFSDGEGWSQMQAHEGAVLSFAQDLAPEGFICGGDDGKFNRVTAEAVSQIADFGMKWVDHAASFAHPKNGLLACSVGKNLHLFAASGEKLRSFAHPSTVTGIAFDAKGKRIAASHYNGASLWFTASSSANPRLLEWKGSHIGVALHPDGEALVTAMQENALHGWTLPEGKHMRMSGYPAKTESFGFTRSGKWLATAGADALVLWPFFGGGPMGKAPLELAGGEGSSILRRLACHPLHEVVAAGFDDGLVVMVDIAREKILPVAAPGRGSVSAIAWNASGSHLAFGTADGFAAIVDFSSRE